MKEVSLPVYNQIRGRLKSWNIYAILHVIFAETEIIVYVHKKIYLVQFVRGMLQEEAATREQLKAEQEQVLKLQQKTPTTNQLKSRNCSKKPPREGTEK